MNFSCPGKIFLVGEYACIVGHDALLVATHPRFELNVQTTTPMPAHNFLFAAQSPAGLLLNSQPNFNQNHLLKWSDPYATPIGVGSSSAQFLLTYFAMLKAQNPTLMASDRFSYLAEVLKQYWLLVNDTQGLRPSGADIACQLSGGLVHYKNQPLELNKIDSLNEFSNSDCSLLLGFTGKKTATHHHLLALKARGFPQNFESLFADLTSITLNALAALKNLNHAQLGQAFNSYQQLLFSQGFASASFQEPINYLQKIKGVLGCKGSGAQDGDCLLLLVANSELTNVKQALEKLSIKPIDLIIAEQGLAF